MSKTNIPIGVINRERYLYPGKSVLSDQEWLKMYPKEVRALARENLIELEPEYQELRQEIIENFRKVNSNLDDFELWLIDGYPTEVVLVPQLIKLGRQISRLKRLLNGPDKQANNRLDIERARQVPLEDVLELELKPAGGGKLKGLCPFHQERTPSFIVFPDNHYHCYGCGKHGNPIDYLIENEGLTFREAVTRLNQF